MSETGREPTPCLYGRDPKDCPACRESQAIHEGREATVCPRCGLPLPLVAPHYPCIPGSSPPARETTATGKKQP